MFERRFSFNQTQLQRNILSLREVHNNQCQTLPWWRSLKTDDVMTNARAIQHVRLP